MNQQKKPSHEHCLHPYRGAIHMVLPDGHTLMKCCKCEHTETKHRDHQHRDHMERP
jgi:hypothetical protein